MLKWLKQLDEILRGEATQLPALQQGRISIPIGGLTVVLAMLGLVYGACVGSYAMIQSDGQAYMQFIASIIKLPLLFFLTLVVTFPSLYVFNALIGSRLSVVSALRLLVASLGVILAVVASLGPIVVFFALSTTSYPFMIILNVAVCTVSGILGLGFLLRTLHRLVIIQEGSQEWFTPPPIKSKQEQSQENPENNKQQEPGQKNKVQDYIDGKSQDNQQKDSEGSEYLSPLDRVGRFTSQRAKSVFKAWMVVFALVGAQMSWVLRPFIGSPDMPFTWFREQQSNFFVAVFKAFVSLFGG